MAHKNKKGKIPYDKYMERLIPGIGSKIRSHLKKRKLCEKSTSSCSLVVDKEQNSEIISWAGGFTLKDVEACRMENWW